MPLGFRSEAAKDLHAVYQFEISGAESFTARLQIKDDQCLFHEGPADKPDVIIKSPADVWMAISEGEINGQTAFMSGKYRVEGEPDPAHQDERPLFNGNHPDHPCRGINHQRRH